MNSKEEIMEPVGKAERGTSSQQVTVKTENSNTLWHQSLKVENEDNLQHEKEDHRVFRFEGAIAEDNCGYTCGKFKRGKEIEMMEHSEIKSDITRLVSVKMQSSDISTPINLENEVNVPVKQEFCDPSFEREEGSADNCVECNRLSSVKEEDVDSTRRKTPSRLIPSVNYIENVNVTSDINPEVQRHPVPDTKPEFLIISSCIKVQPEPRSQIQNRGNKIENDSDGEGNFENFELNALTSSEQNLDFIKECNYTAVTVEKLDNISSGSVSWEPEVLYLKREQPASDGSPHSKPIKLKEEKLEVSRSEDSAECSKDGSWKIEEISNGEDLVKNIKKMVSMKMKANMVDSPSAQRYLKRRTCPNTKIEPDEFFNEILKDVALSEDQSETIRELRSKIDLSDPETIRFTDGFKFHLCLVCGYQTHVPANMTNHVRIHTGEKPFVCKECDYRCTTSQSLRVHKRTHTGEKPYGCSFCSYRTRSSNQLKLHTLVHEGKKPQQCSTCDFRCRDPNTLKHHLRCHTGEKPYACSQCDYRCRKSGSMKLHMRTHSGEKPYKCSFCNYACTGSSTLAVHIRIHTGEKPYSCKLCTYETASAARLKTHTRTHTGDKPFECSFCGYTSATQGRLASHVRTHTGEKTHLCPFCDYKSARSDNLKVHLQTHTGEKPYACHLCEYRASENAQLKSHIRRHTGEKPYACKVCGFKATDSSSLKKHEKVHSAEKPLKCGFCDYRTGHAGTLKHHIMRHTGDKPYSCPYCSYRAIKSDTVKNHVRSRHRDVTILHEPTSTQKEFSCAFCSFHTLSRELMESHARNHIR